MERKITGTIGFEITFDTETHNVEVNYETSMQNDMAALAIVQMILASAEDHQRQMRDGVIAKDKNSRDYKKDLGTTLNYIKKGRSGAARILTILLDNYEEYEKHEASQIEEKEQVIKNWIKDNNVTLTESGTISDADVQKILNKKKTNENTQD